jgi:hypothetical protein
LKRRTVKKKVARHYRDERTRWRRLNLDSHPRWAKEAGANKYPTTYLYNAREATFTVGGVEYKGAIDISVEERRPRVTSTPEQLAQGIFTMTIEMSLSPTLDFVLIDDALEPEKKC